MAPQNAKIKKAKHDLSRLFVDTSYVLGIYNKGDQFHSLCVQAIPFAQKANHLFITDVILMEIGNAFSSVQLRSHGSKIIRDFFKSPRITVVHLTPEYFEQTLKLYEKRIDKEWGMVDCFSFIVMQAFRLKVCLSTDHHFVQSGFKILPF